ncbi:hypothetical protein M8C21_019343 [Ambrosia artemisiifolia]|uniref:Uncharacterized protein n=1 Tax=Ambrosia artemisiifolia TaxID=4212 RepID=A0AAD5GWX1_AMBAR|nr:hypothetical protein M8C21_019343 [Ambrosia artemisiifolia]
MAYNVLGLLCFSCCTDPLLLVKRAYEVVFSRRELADQLTGHVLILNLLMCGCRVIRKSFYMPYQYHGIKHWMDEVAGGICVSLD